MIKFKLLKNSLKALACLVVATSVSTAAQAQCEFSESSLWNESEAPTMIGDITLMSSCMEAGYHGLVTGFESDKSYTLSFSGSSAPYVTVFDGADTTAVAFGSAPFVFIPPANGTYLIQWNNGSGCGTDFNCHNAFITLTGWAFSCINPAVAGSAVSTPAQACADQDITLSLTGATSGEGMTYQWQSSADGVTFTDIAGAVSPTYTTTQATATYYHAILTCSAGTAVTSANVNVPMSSFINCYCSSVAQGDYDEDIFNVSIGTLDNSSDCDGTTTGASEQNMYSDYTDLPATELAKTAAYNFSVEIGECENSYSNWTKAYIDFDQNGSFSDEGEEVYSSAMSGSGPHTETGTVTIPASATEGLTRMRVITVQTDFEGDVDPCNSYYAGETEDYFVDIKPVPSCPQPLDLAVASSTLTSVTVEWTPGDSETAWEIEYGPVGFTPGQGDGTVIPSAVSPQTIGSLATTSFFDVYVRAICGPSDNSLFTGPLHINTYAQGAFLEWNSECNPGGYVDITSTGTNMGLGDDEEGTVTLPWLWVVQGQPITDLRISNNGGLLFAASGNVFYDDPAQETPGMYVFNQDLDDPNEGGGVFYQSIGTTPGTRKFVIQWYNMPHYNNEENLDGIDVEIIYDEATMEIYYQYRDVAMSNPNWDNGADANIALRTSSQAVTVSFDNADYLTDNSCVHFEYTDCPRPTDFSVSYTAPEEAGVEWISGLANEPEWTVEYGLAGFTPGSGTELTETNAASLISGLTQNTTYDVYVYALCANGDISNPLIGHVTTAPLCSNPTDLSAGSDIDSLELDWDWATSGPDVTSFFVQYGTAGADISTGTTVNTGSVVTSDTIHDTGLLAGGVYEVYVTAVCGTDSSTMVGPITVTMPLTNDLVCGAELLPVNGIAHTFNNNDATVSTGESAIAPPANGAQVATGWTNSTLNNTTWFKFVAPASGKVRINNTGVEYNGQAAVYAVQTCGTFSTFVLLAANDNAIGGTSVAPNFTVCGLTPGTTYFLLHDGFNSSTGDYSISLSPISLEAGTANDVTNVCSGNTVNLSGTIAGSSPGGIWSSTISPVNSAISGSMLNTTGLAYQVYNLKYRLADGCASDSVISQVHVFGPSSAGDDGTITTCRNTSIDLLTGLTGNVDIPGTWRDPANVPFSGSVVTTSNFPGEFNYDYITNNGVCPSDTANVLVIVGNCTLGVDELVFEDVSVYPNPSEGIVFIQSGATEDFTYTITDSKGRVVGSAENGVKAAQVTEINLSKVNTGMYFIRLTNAQAEKTFRVVIQ